MQLFYVPKNAGKQTRNMFGNFRNRNEALSSGLTNLYSAQVAHERIAIQHLAMGNFPFGSRFAPEASRKFLKTTLNPSSSMFERFA